MALVRLSSRKDNCGNISHNDNVMKRELKIGSIHNPLSCHRVRQKSKHQKTRKQTKLVSCLGHDHLLSLSVLDERGSAHCFLQDGTENFLPPGCTDLAFSLFSLCAEQEKGRGGSIRAFQLLTAETKVKEQLRGCE